MVSAYHFELILAIIKKDGLLPSFLSKTFLFAYGVLFGAGVKKYVNSTL
jgi:hypothetical protein